MVLHDTARGWRWPAQESTQLIIEQMSRAWKRPLPPSVQQMVLWRLVELRCCPLCGAGEGQLCFVYGGFTNIFRTHHVRLAMTRGERTAVINWALRVSAQRPRGGAGEDLDEAEPA